MSSIKINLRFPVHLYRKCGYYLASCEKLDVHAEGETADEALQNIRDALDVFISTCIWRAA